MVIGLITAGIILWLFALISWSAMPTESTRRIAKEKAKEIERFKSSEKIAQLERDLLITLDSRIDDTDRWIKATDLILNPLSESELQEVAIAQAYAIPPHSIASSCVPYCHCRDYSPQDYKQRPLVTHEACQVPLGTCRYCGAGLFQSHRPACPIVTSLKATDHEDDCFMCNHPELP